MLASAEDDDPTDPSLFAGGGGGGGADVTLPLARGLPPPPRGPALEAPRPRVVEDERRLVESARTGDDSAIEALYRTHYDTIYRYVFHRVGSAEAAEDVTSQVFLGMLRGLPRFRWQGRPFLAWLYAIAHKQLAYHYRSAAKVAVPLDAAALDEAVADSLAPEASAEERERCLVLSRALRRLPDSQREAVLLRHVLGLSLAEAAAALDCSEGAVKQLARRGLSTLKEILASSGGRPPR